MGRVEDLPPGWTCESDTPEEYEQRGSGGNQKIGKGLTITLKTLTTLCLGYSYNPRVITGILPARNFSFGTPSPSVASRVPTMAFCVADTSATKSSKPA